MFTTAAVDFDTIFYLYDGNGALVGCEVEGSSLVLNVSAGAVYRIVVDTASPPPGESSTFTLNICSPQLCNSPPGSKDCFDVATCAPSGACEYRPKSAATPCDDQNACTAGDACDASGTCRGSFACVASAHATPVCRCGSCDFDCQPGFLRCGNACVSGSDVNNCGQTTTEFIDPVWQRSNERYGYLWWQTARDGVPDVKYYAAEGGAWTWTTPTPVPWTWQRYDMGRNVSWFWTTEGPSTANSWFRTTLPAKEGKRLIGFSLTSADKHAQGIGINDGIYVFVDGRFSGAFASVAAGRSSNATPNIGVVRDMIFPTEWRCGDLWSQVNDAGPASHEIAVAFEEDFGWGGLTRLRIVAKYELVTPPHKASETAARGCALGGAARE